MRICRDPMLQRCPEFIQPKECVPYLVSEQSNLTTRLSQPPSMVVYTPYVVSSSPYSHLPISPVQVTLIPGDGVGAEITDSVKEIFDHVNAPIQWEQYDVSGVSSSGEALFKQAMDSLKRNRVGLKGNYMSLSTSTSL